MEEEYNLNELKRVADFYQNYCKFIQELMEKTKNHSGMKKKSAVKLELKTNVVFLNILKEKEKISKMQGTVFQEIEKLEKMLQFIDEEENKNLATEVIEMDGKIDLKADKNLIGNKIQGKRIENNSNPVKSIDNSFKNDEKVKLIIENENYFPLEPLGQGGFGQVYKARKNSDNKEYALKVIDVSKMPQKYLTVEQKAHLTLNNQKEHIIYFYEDIQLSPEYKCLVLELADCSLDGFLKEHYPNVMPENIAFFFFEQIMKGIRYIHGKRIIHRDIKTLNVLLKDFKVKICDFNVCRFIDSSEDQNAVLTIVGAKQYFAPEFAKHQDIPKENWSKVDIYSLGILLYVLLYGKNPYEFNRNFTFGNTMENEIKSINFENSDHSVSKEAVSLIRDCLKINGAERPSLDGIKGSDWVKKRGGEFNSVAKNNKIESHKQMYDLLVKSNKINK